ncbi:PiggyBac transposable element-derived protein 2 [Trichinella pseudospiralis]|uniref:PiggyBac transposable element-derived protein 2 n=1 Tax=Trichinella pseudospiralis TaxID=6337 RepID=A0A0V1JB06_TRIPS|nr:PiggyBac transposable element-derived protein 2 [Trichinella pseudospiralis]
MDFDTIFRETRSGRKADEEIPSVLRPIEYFRMYFTAQLLSHIAFETNRKATQSLYSNLATTAAEIEVLIGMLITMGICEMPRYRMYWANQTRMDTIANCMSRNRFETLLRFLHFNDNDKVVMDRNHPDYDRFYKIRSLIESIRKTCLEETPGELQSVDEHIIPYKGRCKMKYYNPRKPDKWGLKDAGKMDSSMTFELENSIGFFATDVVIKVCETLPKHKGCKVFFDNYFAFFELQESLLRALHISKSPFLPIAPVVAL